MLEQLMASRLPQEEIQKRLNEFNESYNWSVFADVPDCQFVDIMYPHRFKHEFLEQLLKGQKDV